LPIAMVTSSHAMSAGGCLDAAGGAGFSPAGAGADLSLFFSFSLPQPAAASASAIHTARRRTI
jgi:hypothetical protein